MVKRKKKSSAYYHLFIVVFLTLVVLIPESNVFSQNLNDSEDEIKEGIEINVNKQIDDVSTGAKGIGKGIDSTLEKEFVIPEGLDIFARVVFGIKETITLQMFLIYLFVWILVFISISQAVCFMPGFSDCGIKSYAVGFIVTCLASISGGMKLGANFFFGASEVFTFLEGMSSLKLFLSVLIILVLLFIISIAMKYFKTRLIMDSADIAGTQAAAGIKIAKNMYKAAVDD